MAKDVEFVDLPTAGNEKYPELLDAIRKASAGSNGRWAMLTEFTNSDSARDTSNRLKKTHLEFEFTTRSFVRDVGGKDQKGATIYARYIGGM